MPFTESQDISVTLSSNTGEIPDAVCRNLQSSFDVIFSWDGGSTGIFKSGEIIYHDHTNEPNWAVSAYKFWQNTQFVIYRMFGYEASFITMVYGELLHDCVLHVESRKGSEDSVSVQKLKDFSFLIKIVVSVSHTFNDSVIFKNPPLDKLYNVKLSDLVSFGYGAAKSSSLQLDETMVKTINQLSDTLSRRLVSLLNVNDDLAKHVVDDIALMLVSYGYPSNTFGEKCFSLYNQKAYSSGEKNYSSGGKFVIWKRPVVCDLVDNSEYQLWMKTLKLEGFSRTIVNLLYLSRYQATQSAIGSIMSRNGSHNIGSHVLAGLSHNVGTMPDDQVLYQYIQHRMDYIATATTDRPTWCQPTMFVGEMMKRLLSQRHLLNYISRSEGLKAWEFQSDRASLDKGGRIKFHIRRIERDADNGELTGTKDFIDYDHLEEPIDLSEDVSLSIPGGIVGQHAFFTIIENIVRNAAKHDWTTPPPKTRQLKYKNESDASRTPESINEPGDEAKKSVEIIPDGDLDVYIDMEDNPAEDNVHFIVWTRLSDVFDKMDGQPQPTAPLSKKEVKDCLKKDDLGKLPLHRHQQVELARPFIREDGSLRRENWGLAEMKISAGYLQKASIEAIGGLEPDAEPIIKPVCVPDKYAREDKILDVFHLGYRFDIPRAKFILFLVDKLPGNMNKLILQDFQRNGIYVKLVCDITLKTELNYQYVVMDQFGRGKDQDKVANESLKWMLPFRVIAMKGREEFLEDKVPIFKRILRKKGTFAGLDEKVMSASDYLSTMIAEGANVADICNAIKEDVCACWVRHLIAQRKDLDGPLSLVVSVAGSQDESSGKSLITEEDIVEFAFNEGLPQAFDTYEKTGAGLPVVVANQPIIDVLRKRGESGDLVYERAELAGTAKFRTDFIKRQLAAWLEACESHASFKDTINHLKAATDDITTLKAELKKVEAELEKGNESSATSQEANRQKKNDLDKRIWKATHTAEKPVDHLVRFLDSYCAQMQRLLSKYAETIATLPKGFSKALKAEGGDSEEELSLVWDAANLFPQQASRMQLRYKRHETVRNPSDKYLEALSGTQSYLNILERMGPTDYKMIAQLAENALMRILIIDERTREFLEKHKDMLVRFANMNVFVANDRKVDWELELLEKGDSLPMGLKQGNADEGVAVLVDLSTQAIFDAGADYKRRIPQGTAPARACEIADQERKAAIKDARKRYHDRYDMLIIHQGIIDKWLPGASHDRQKVESFIHSLKQVFRYVVITTGRGTPANIPNSCRVLPFSTIQTTLFRQYPEKMILTDAIMNILRVKPSESENGHG